MAGSTYSTNLKIELMTTGENSGTWGDVTNTNLGTALEQAVVGYGNPDYASDANLTISITNSNAAQAARALVLNVTSTFGSLTATRELVVPTIQKQYIVQNNTAGGQSITVKTSAGTGITVPNGRKAHLYVDGTNVIQMFDYVDINGGSIDGTPIGASSASTGAFTTLNASGATTLDGNVTLGNASGDTVTVTGTIASNLLFTDNTYDIGASGATRPRNLYLAGAATIGGNLSVGGTLTLTGGLTLNGNVTVGDSASDTLTINSTVTSNLIFTDNTYDIGASGATRPRNLFIAGNITAGGNQTLTGSLTVDSTTDSSSTTTGSIQTDGGVGIAKSLYVGSNTTLGDASTDTVTVNGYMGVGGAGDSRYGMYLRNSALTGTSQYGIVVQPTGSSAATSSVIGGAFAANTAAAAFTATNAVALRADDATKGAGSTITNQHGLYIGDQTQGTNNYGITSLVSSGSNKYNIYASGTAQNYFAGYVGINTSTPAGHLHVAPGNAAGASTAGAPIILQAQTGGSSASGGNILIGSGQNGSGSTNGYVAFGVGSSTSGSAFATGEAARFDASGRFLVNTTSAVYTNSKLQVTASSGPTLGIQQTTNTDYVAGFWNSSASSDRKLLSFFYGAGGSQLASLEATGTTLLLYGAGSNGISINSSGYVGTGTVTTPTFSTSFSATNSTVLQVANSGAGQGQIRVGGNTSSAIGLTLNYDNGGSTTSTIRAEYGATTGNALLYIDSGTTVFRNGTSFAESGRFNSSGELLLGTTGSATSPLSIQAKTSGYSIWSINDATLNFSQFYFGGSANSGFQFIRSDGRSGGWLAFGTQDTERIRITSAGLTGFGITTPAHPIDAVADYGSGSVVTRNYSTHDFTTTGVLYSRNMCFGGISHNATSTRTSITPTSSVWRNSSYGAYVGAWMDVDSGSDSSSNVVGYMSRIAGTATNTGYIAYQADLTGTPAGADFAYGLYVKGELANYFSGKVGLNNTTPTARLEIAFPFSGSTATNLGDVSKSQLHIGAPGYTSQYAQITFGYDVANAPAAIGYVNTDASAQTKGALVFATRNVTTSTLPTERLRITADGAFVVGSATQYGSAGSLSGPFSNYGSGSTNTGAIVWGQYSSSAGVPQYCGNWASNASWGIGPHSSSNDNILRIGQISASGAAVTWNGSYVNIYAGSYTNASDYRIKENVANVGDGVLEKVMALRVVNYNVISVPDTDGDTPPAKDEVGFIAHEIQEQFPVLVSGNKDDVDGEGNAQHQGVDYAKLSAYLVKAIQELKSEFDAYKASHP